MKKTTAVILALACSQPSSAAATPKDRKTQHSSDKQRETKFDPSWMKVPKRFAGDDFRSLCRSLTTERDQFETTVAYRKRMGAAVDPARAYVFIAHHDGLNLRYDADKESLEGTLWDISGIVLDIDTVKLKPYVGSNAFGAKAVVENRSSEFYELRTPSGIKRDVSISMKPIEARDRLYRLRELLIVSFPAQDANAYCAREERLREPTFERPVDELRTVYTITAEIKEVWVFDGDTGEVLQKVTLTDASPQQ
jgi:hypothetical protein